MMTIKDLSSSKDLDSKAMTDVRGGQTINAQTVAQGAQNVTNNSYGGFALGVQEVNATSFISAAEVHTGYYYDKPDSYTPDYEKHDYDYKW